MATVKGVWVWNDLQKTWASSETEAVVFTVNGDDYAEISYGNDSIHYIYANGFFTAVYDNGIWFDEAFRTIDFGTEEQEVSNEFYSYLTTNAVQQSSIPEGYRLLTKSDVGKTFGVELEPYVWIDTSVQPVNDRDAFTTQYLAAPDVHFEAAELYFMTNFICMVDNLSATYTWNQPNVEIVQSTAAFEVISGWSTDYPDWNNWLYVKDKTIDEESPQGHNITINLINCYTTTILPENYESNTNYQITLSANEGYKFGDATLIGQTANINVSFDINTRILELSNITGDAEITVNVQNLNPNYSPVYVMSDGIFVKKDAYKKIKDTWMQMSVAEETYVLESNEYGDTIILNRYIQQNNTIIV